MAELLPCPFCGTEQVPTVKPPGPQEDIVCHACHGAVLGSPSWRPGRATTSERWNRRAPASEPPEEVHVECDISRNKTWSGQYSCGLHGVSFRGNDQPELCPVGRAIVEHERGR